MPFSSIAESEADEVPTSQIKIQTRDTFDYTEKNVIKSGESRIIHKSLPPGLFTLRLFSNKKIICSIVVSHLGRPFYELRAQVGGSKKNQRFETVLAIDKEKNPANFQAKLENKSRLFGSPSQFKFEIHKQSPIQSGPNNLADEKIPLKILLSDSELGKLSIRKLTVSSFSTFNDLSFILQREFNYPHLLFQYEDTDDGSMIDLCSQEGWESLLSQFHQKRPAFITLIITPEIDFNPPAQGSSDEPDWIPDASAAVASPSAASSSSSAAATVSGNLVNTAKTLKFGQPLPSLLTKTTPYGNPIRLSSISDDTQNMVVMHSREGSRDSTTSPLRVSSKNDESFEPHSAPAGYSHTRRWSSSNFFNLPAQSNNPTSSSNSSSSGHRHTNSTLGIQQRRSHEDDDLYGSPTRITSAVLELRNLKDSSQNEQQTLSGPASVSPRFVSSSSPIKAPAVSDPRQLEKLRRRLSQEFSRRPLLNYFEDTRNAAFSVPQALSMDRDNDPFGDRRPKPSTLANPGLGGVGGGGVGPTAATISSIQRLDSKKVAIPSDFSKPHSNKHIQGQIRWKRANLIGSGAFGNVYLGMDTKTGKFLAVKQIEMGKQLTPDQKRKLEEEIDLMKNLSHPHIVRYYGMEITENHINIFLEYVPGGSIESLLRKFGKFGEAVASCYTQQILLGLQYLHERGVLHRDIKGANLLVDENGNVKLADFGSSKSIDELNALGGRSLTGTPNFMAPEVIINARYTNGSDIWAVGCTVLEMLTGQPPWTQMNFDNPISAMFHIAQSKKGPTVPSNLSEQAKSFINACFSMDSDNRPTATELLNHPFITAVEDLSDDPDEYLATTTAATSNPDLPETGPSIAEATPMTPNDSGDVNQTIIEYEDWSSSELVTDYDQQSSNSESLSDDEDLRISPTSATAVAAAAASSTTALSSSSSGSERSLNETGHSSSPPSAAPLPLSAQEKSTSAEMLSNFMESRAHSHLSKSSRRNQSARFDSVRAKILRPYILGFLRRNAAEQRNMVSSLNEEPFVADTANPPSSMYMSPQQPPSDSVSTVPT